MVEEAFSSLDASVAPISLYRGIRLPPELIDLVIDALHDDREALKICVLVCRSWVHASRHHLFSHLTVSSETISDLVALLSSASCTIGPAAQYLTLLQMNDLHEIPCKLPHVSRLTLRDSAISESQAFTSPAVVSFLQHLESLTLLGVEFDNSNTFLSLLLPCIRLRTLDWFNASVIVHDLQPFPFDRNALAPELRALGIFSDCEDPLNWMMAYWGSEIPQLTKLSLNFNSRSPVLHVVKRLLEAVGSSLQVLESSDSQPKREWSHPYIHQSLNRFTYFTLHSTQFRSSHTITLALHFRQHPTVYHRGPAPLDVSASPRANHSHGPYAL
jgi:hypothetical protein